MSQGIFKVADISLHVEYGVLSGIVRPQLLVQHLDKKVSTPTALGAEANKRLEGHIWKSRGFMNYLTGLTKTPTDSHKR